MGTGQGAEARGAARPAGAGREAAFLRALVERLDPTDATALNNAGVLLATRGLVDDALDAFLRALDNDPRFRVAADNLTRLDAGSAAVGQRIHALEELLRDDPTDTPTRRTLARLLRLLGRGAEAVPHLDLLLAQADDDVALVFERALVEHIAGTPLRAQRWCERTLALDPTHAPARLKLAEALYHQGRSDAALTVLLDAFARGEDSAEAHLLHSFVLGDLGSADDACQAAALAARRNPSLRRGESAMQLPDGFAAPRRDNDADREAEVRLTMIVAFRERGYLEEAVAECERLLADGMGAAREAAEQMLGELLLVLGRAPEALARYEQRLAEAPDDARLLAESGVALHQAGAREAAEFRYRAALAERPSDALTWYNLGVLEAERDARDAAREAFTEARARDAEWSLPLAAEERLAFGDGAHTLPLALAVLREWPEARLPDRAPVTGRGTRGDARRTPVPAPAAPGRPTPSVVPSTPPDAPAPAPATLLAGASRATAHPAVVPDLAALRDAVLAGAWARAEQLLSAAPDHRSPSWRLLRARVLAQGDAARRALAVRELRALLADGALLDAAALHFAGDTAAAMGDETTAMTAWRRALARDPERPDARVAVARVLLDQGQRTAAMVEATAAVAVAPTVRAVAVGGSEVLRVTGAVPTAVRTLARYLLDAPEDVEALCALGAALLAMKELTAARGVWARARAIDPTADAVRVLGDAVARVEARGDLPHLAGTVDASAPAGATA